MSDDLDLLDQHLRTELRGSAPRAGDADATLDALTPRFRRARRRHRTTLVTSAAAVVAAFVVGGVALFGPAGDATREVRVPPANRTGQPRPAPTVSNPLPTTSTPVPTMATAPGSDDGTPAASPTGALAPAADAQPSAGASPSSPTAPPAPVEHAYSSDGGSVTVRVADGALSIVSSAPAPGYTEERHDTGPDRVEVRFHNADGEWRIRVDLVNGEVVEETTHH
jgi:hypothetical protein